jgi:hypothetical protein
LLKLGIGSIRRECLDRSAPRRAGASAPIILPATRLRSA